MKLLAKPFLVSVEVNPDLLQWPEDVIDAGNAENRSFADFSDATWADTDLAIDAEADRLERCLAKATAPGEYWAAVDDLDDEMYEDFDNAGLEFGVGATVFALNAAQCPTCISCNGHGREAAWVDFWTTPDRVPLLCDLAKRAGVGLNNNEGGTLVVYSDEADGLLRFAKELRANAHAFPAPPPARDVED